MVKMEKQYFPWHTLRNVLVGWAGKRSTFVCVPTYWLSLLMLFTILLLFMFFSPIVDVAAAAAAVYFFCVQRLVKLLCEQASYLWLEWIWNCAWKAAITYAQFPTYMKKENGERKNGVQLMFLPEFSIFDTEVVQIKWEEKQQLLLLLLLLFIVPSNNTTTIFVRFCEEKSNERGAHKHNAANFIFRSFWRLVRLRLVWPSNRSSYVRVSPHFGVWVCIFMWCVLHFIRSKNILWR